MEDWQKASLEIYQNAYQSSPYFDLRNKAGKYFKDQPKTLLAFNLKAMKIIFTNFKTRKSNFRLPKNIKKISEMIDFRSAFSVKKDTEYNMDEYYQTF